MATTQDMIGTVLGARYRIIDKLGEGSMSEVYLAEHQHIGRREAVKVLRPEMATDPTFVGRFRREARAINRVQHPNIIGIYDFGQLPDGRLYLAMEYADGPSVETILVEGALPVLRAVKIVHQLASAVDHAHSKGVVHRDLKPENLILVENRGQRDVLKVLDFGMSKILCSDENDQLTQRGEMFGTPEYMAPESLNGSTDPRMDIYAIGCITYELITGTPPFSGHRVQLIQQHMETIPEPPSKRAPEVGIPQVLDAVIMRCLDKEPAARYQSGLRLKSAFEAVPGFEKAGQRTRRLFTNQKFNVEVHEESTHSESQDWSREKLKASLATADTASVSVDETLTGVYDALLELAEEMLDGGHESQQLRLALAGIRALSDDAARLDAERDDLETREALAEQSSREREGSLRFAIGELRFDREHSQTDMPDDIDFQLRALEQRLNELVAETKGKLESMTEEGIALAASHSQVHDYLVVSYKQLLMAVGECAAAMDVDETNAHLKERYESIAGALSLMTAV